MKVLIVTNLYPPHHLGGYELRCAQVAEHLQRQGHDVHVATSSYRISGATEGARVEDDRANAVGVTRFLNYHRLDRWRSRRLHYLSVVRRQIADAKRFGDIVDEFRPDVVSWWNMEGITKTLLGMPPSRGLPSVHEIDDNWMIREFGAAGDVDLPLWFDFWRGKWGPRPLRPMVRRVLAPLERRVHRHGIPTRVFGIPPCHVCFISEFWRFQHQQAGLVAESSEVIYGGVSPQSFFVGRSAGDYTDVPLRLLYAGFVDQRRGLHTIIEALGLIPPPRRDRMHLSVAFPGPVAPDDYLNGILRRIAELGLSTNVTFLPRVPHDEMPRVYSQHHMLVFASTRAEGMPMTMMEAMCAGCAVLTTGSGGAIELAERADLPLFPTDHPFALSRLLSALETDRERVADVALRGQRVVLRDFTLDQMVGKTCEALSRAVERARRPPAFTERLPPERSTAHASRNAVRIHGAVDATLETDLRA